MTPPEGAKDAEARLQHPKSLRFPAGFLWGTATSSHQVEGHNRNNDWWLWEQLPGKIRDGSTSAVACDWWHRAEQDFDLAREMGQNSHRLSLEWSRIEPRPGEWDHGALDRYRQMLGALRDRGIEPMVTLHHFTLPIWAAARRGWENPEIVERFDRYVEYVVAGLGDLCDLWCTINEPMIYIAFGYLEGIWPPGYRSPTKAVSVFRSLVRAHACAYHAIHRRQGGARVGMAKHLRPFDPANPDSPMDRLLARFLDRLFNIAFLRAITEGVIRWPWGWQERVSQARDTCEFIGVNYYSRDMVAFDPHRPTGLFTRRFANPASEFSMEGWGEVYPEGLYRVLKRVAAYRKPVYITEVGIPDNTDAQRPRFILTHMAATHRAIEEEVPVAGVYFWSLVDNFEWAEGYTARFGLVGVDFDTQERRVRASGRLYAEIARANAISRDMVRRYAPEVMERILTSPPSPLSAALALSLS